MEEYFLAHEMRSLFAKLYAILLGFLQFLFSPMTWIFVFVRRYTYFNKIPGPNFFRGMYAATKIMALSPEKSQPVEAFRLMCRFAKEFDNGGIFALWLWSRPYIFLYKKETIEVVLRSSSLIDKPVEIDMVKFITDGILTSSGEKWRSHRKLLNPAFRQGILNGFMPTYNEQAKCLVEKMKNLSEKGCVDLSSIISNCMVDIICETAMGVQVNAQSDPENEYVRALHNIKEMCLHRIAKPWLWVDSIYFLLEAGRKNMNYRNIIKEFTRKVINEKKALILHQENERALEDDGINLPISNNTGGKQKAVLDLLLECHAKDPTFTEEHISEEVTTLLATGHDTVTTAVYWALYEIGLNPDVQDNIFQELDSVFNGDKERPVTCKDLRDLKYLDCVLKEALRVHPTVPYYLREITEDVVISGYTIPTGCIAFIFPFVLHKDPEVFPEPEKFDPDRFLPENAAGRHPFAYIPFSAGPRICIGQKFAIMECITILAHILRNFQITSLVSRDEVEMYAVITLRSDTLLKMHLKPR